MEDAFNFRLEILKKELDSINTSMKKIDDIGNSIKNWAILIWAGSISAILSKTNLHNYMVFTAVLPLVFMVTDAYWRQIQRRFSYRQKQIANFLNSKKLDESFKTKVLDFKLLDPIAKNASKDEQFKKYTSIIRILTYPTVSFIYIGLSFISLVLTCTLLYFPNT